jgi:hypothetical protein
MDDTTGCAIIDLGSLTTKIGFHTDDCPRFMVPTVIGRPKPGGIQRSTTFGDNAIASPASQRVTHMLDRDLLAPDYEGLAEFVPFLFEQLRVDPTQTVTVFTDPASPDYQVRRGDDFDGEDKVMKCR